MPAAPFAKRKCRERGTPGEDGQYPLSLNGCFTQLTSFPRRRESRGVWQTGTSRLFGLVTAPISSCAKNPQWERAMVRVKGENWAASTATGSPPPIETGGGNPTLYIVESTGQKSPPCSKSLPQRQKPA